MREEWATAPPCSARSGHLAEAIIFLPLAVSSELLHWHGETRNTDRFFARQGQRAAGLCSQVKALIPEIYPDVLTSVNDQRAPILTGPEQANAGEVYTQNPKTLCPSLSLARSLARFVHTLFLFLLLSLSLSHTHTHSIFELPLDAVPNFIAAVDPYESLHKFAGNRGLGFIKVG